jgi:hypothetical protein
VEVIVALDHTQTHTHICRTPLDEGSARRRDLYQTTHSIHKRQTFMRSAGIEPAIPTSERPQTYALDRVPPGIDYFHMGTSASEKKSDFFVGGGDRRRNTRVRRFIARIRVSQLFSFRLYRLVEL